MHASRTSIRTSLRAHAVLRVLLLAWISLWGAAAHAALPAAGGDEDFLPVREAFRLTIDRDGHAFTARWTIADHYYMYRSRFRFTLLDAAGKESDALGTPQFPAGEFKDDEIFGRVEVYHHEVRVKLPLKSMPAFTQGTLKVTYQGCAEAGLCYPPEKEEWPLDFTGMKVAPEASATPTPSTVATTPASSAASSAAPTAAVAPGSAAAPVAPQAAAATDPVTQTTAAATPAATAPSATDAGAIANFLAHASFLAIVGTCLLLGLGLAFTPCVLPMVPILSSIIVGEGHGLSTRRAFTLSLAYVLGMALTYTAAGVAVGFLGQKANVSMWLQAPAVLLVFAAVFVALAMSMFGFYELQVPAFLRDRLNDAAGKQQGGKFVGVLVMGAISALVVSPCVSAPLAGVLVFISSTGDAVLGGSALFALAMGMGVPLLMIGTSGGKLLPKAGAWMNGVKAFFGVMLLGVAILLVGRILPGWANLALWGSLLMVSAIYLKALEPLSTAANGWAHLRKGAGLVLMLIGATMLVGAAGGADDPLQPLGFLKGGVAGAPAAQAEKPLFTRVKDETDLAAKLADAKAAGKPVMLDFFAEWCVACKLMERDVFSKASVHQALSGYVVLQVDATDNNDVTQALMKTHRIMGLPSILFFRPDGTELTADRIQGELDEAGFLAFLNDRVTPATR